METKNYGTLSERILKAVGGRENVSYFAHCVTRLRINVRDKSLVRVDEVGAISGVLGAQWLGEQLQVIIGADVDKVYSAICKAAGISEQAAIDENLDAGLVGNKKFSIKDIGGKILSYLTGSMTGILPILVSAAMCRTISSLLGPDMLKVITAESDLYILFNNILFNACFYFLPIFLGYAAAKALKTDILLGIYMGTLIIVPDFVKLVGASTTFSVFGISTPVADYGQTFLPVILGVWIMSYVYKFFKKVIPEAITLWLPSLLTIIVMTPVMFVGCAPLGSYVGNLLGSLFMLMADSNIVVRIIGSAILGVVFPYILLFGMHGAAYLAAFTTYFTYGYESFLMPMGYIYGWAVVGMGLGALIKYKQKENKGLASGYLISNLLGGLTEPTLYALCLKNKTAMKVLLISSGIGGLINGIIQARVYAPVMSTIFTATIIWTGGSIDNLIKGIALEVICFVTGLLGTLLLVDLGEGTGSKGIFKRARETSGVK